MPRRTTASRSPDLEVLLARDDLVVSHAELRTLGFPISTATFRCRVDGPWQTYVPGVILAHNGPPSARQRERAALKYAGDHAVLTGAAALRRHGVPRVPMPGAVRILVPAARRRQSRPEIVVERSARMPSPHVILGLPCAPVARALVDECRQLKTLNDIRFLVASVVQSGYCSVSELVEEIRCCQRRGSGLPRMVLQEISSGIRSVSEAKVRSTFLKAGLVCEWNVTLLDEQGDFLAQPDGWFDAEAVACEVDSMEWHLSPEDYRRTQRRQAKMAAAGILVIPLAPSDFERNSDATVAAVRAALIRGAARPRPCITVQRRPVDRE